MPRYIDADLIDLTKYKIGRSLATDWIDIEDVKRAIALTPTADVVPKNEVDKLKIEIEALKIANEKMYAANKEQQAEIDSFLESVDELQAEKADVTYFKKQLIANEKAEVAREIFEELVREVYSKIPDKILPVTFGEMSRHLDYNDGLNFGSRNAYFDTLKIIAELKKKYTEDA